MDERYPTPPVVEVRHRLISPRGALSSPSILNPVAEHMSSKCALTNLNMQNMIIYCYLKSEVGDDVD
jgi:hypothetical protein